PRERELPLLPERDVSWPPAPRIGVELSRRNRSPTLYGVAAVDPPGCSESDPPFHETFGREGPRSNSSRILRMSARDTHRPRSITPAIRRLLAMLSRGFASSRSRSAF